MKNKTEEVQRVNGSGAPRPLTVTLQVATPTPAWPELTDSFYAAAMALIQKHLTSLSSELDRVAEDHLRRANVSAKRCARWTIE